MLFIKVRPSTLNKFWKTKNKEENKTYPEIQ